MTLAVRVEKADATPYVVCVQVEEVNADGKWQRVGNPVYMQVAAQLLTETIHQNKRLVVYELPALGNT